MYGFIEVEAQLFCPISRRQSSYDRIYLELALLMNISSMLGDAQLRGDVQGPAEAEATGYSQFDSIGR